MATFHHRTGVNFINLLAQSAQCASSHSLAPVGDDQFHQQNYAQLHHYTQLENTLKFYAVCPTLCARGIGVNLLAQKLPVKCWWNWPLKFHTNTNVIFSNPSFVLHRSTNRRCICWVEPLRNTNIGWRKIQTKLLILYNHDSLKYLYFVFILFIRCGKLVKIKSNG